MNKDEYKKALANSLFKKEKQSIDYLQIISDSGIFDTDGIGLIGPYNKIIPVHDALLLKYRLAKELLRNDYYEQDTEKEFITKFKTFAEIASIAGMRRNKITELGMKAHLSSWNKFKPMSLESSISNILIDYISDVSINLIASWVKSIMKSSGKPLSISDKTLRTHIRNKLAK